MAFRVSRSVWRGEIDNRRRGRVTGRLWLVDRETPVELDLTGNCLRDLAGCRFVFVNHGAGDPESGSGLTRRQRGGVGDMTASRKVRVPACSRDEAAALVSEGREVPVRFGNALYLEWFSDTNGRVVVETADFRVERIDGPVWHMSSEDEQQQLQRNQGAIEDYMRELDAILGLSGSRDPDAVTSGVDEFEWERRLREADALAEELASDADEGDAGVPESGLDHRPARGAATPEDENGASLWDSLLPEPDPAREGVDWVRTEYGTVKHPLSYRAFEAVMDVWEYCRSTDSVDETSAPELVAMLSAGQALATKLSGALDNIAYDEDLEPGFIIACLKRALRHFDECLTQSASVRERGTLDFDVLGAFRQELFLIREGMLDLMRELREL